MTFNICPGGIYNLLNPFSMEIDFLSFFTSPLFIGFAVTLFMIIICNLLEGLIEGKNIIDYKNDEEEKAIDYSYENNELLITTTLLKNNKDINILENNY